MTKRHPLEELSLTASFFKCFGEIPGGFDVFEPINLVIGRNNSGKSAVIDIIDFCLSKGKGDLFDRFANSYGDMRIFVKHRIDEQSLRSVFREGTRGGGVPGDTQWDFGNQFVGYQITRSFDKNWNSRIESGLDFSRIVESYRQNYLDVIAKEATWPFDKVQLIRVAAERDVRPEQKSRDLLLMSNGVGVTNLIRAFISDDRLPRSEVKLGLLRDLNSIYAGDCEFSEIICREDINDNWEIFLREESKGDIRLSQSGSSLKSVFIILCMLRLNSFINPRDWKMSILSIEEPENNLHPSLLRKLLNFLSNEREEKKFTLIITTHSPVAIDWAARRSDSQIIHIRHDGKISTTNRSINYVHGKNIIEDLDVRASDMLQANCVIWVEGPSDRIYLKKWIDLISDGNIVEGVHYSVMFYGGKLLSHLDALPVDENEGLISLLSINKNAALLMDSDRYVKSSKKGNVARKPRLHLNSTKLRIKAELERIGGFAWVTEGREVENYIPISVYAKIVNAKAPEVDMYTQIVDLPIMEKYKSNKVSIAHDVASVLEASDIYHHMDLADRLNELCIFIRRWNGISQ